MAMDYGDSAAPNPQRPDGRLRHPAGTELFDQLKTLYGTTKTDAQLWQMVGSHADDRPERRARRKSFDQQEARELLACAATAGHRADAFWSLNRDQQNSRGALNYVDLKTSSVLQSPFEFAKIFAQIEN